MAKWWIGAALVILGFAGRAAANHPCLPVNIGGPPLPPQGFAGEPAPAGPQFCGPAGPPPDSPFTLPNDGTGNAFSCDERGCHETCGWYFSVGWRALQRYKLGHGVVAVIDPGVDIPGVPTNVDSGIQPSRFSPQALNFNNLEPNMNHGVTATWGYRDGAFAVELTGFYLAENESFSVVSAPGRLDLPFSAFPSPLGFQGDNFLWLQADQVRLGLQTQLANGELNFRCSTHPGCDFIIGLRYMDVYELLTIQTDDDSLVLGQRDPTSIANYSIRAHSRILGPQLGFEYDWPVLSRVTIDFLAKGAWGANFIEVDVALQRGDGFFGPSDGRSSTVFGQVYELGLFGTFMFTDNCRIRAGYSTLWVVGVPEATDQTNFDPGNPNARRSNTGSIFYHGPLVELQLAF